MRRSSWDALHDTVTGMDGIDRPDTPTLVVPVLPVIHAYLPPVGAAVPPPPFATYIAVIQPPVGYGFGIGMSRRGIDGVRHKHRIDGLTHRDAGDDCCALLIIAQGFTENAEVDSISGIVTAAYVPYAGEPTFGTLAIAATMTRIQMMISTNSNKVSQTVFFCGEDCVFCGTGPTYRRYLLFA